MGAEWQNDGEKWDIMEIKRAGEEKGTWDISQSSSNDSRGLESSEVYTGL